MLNWRTERCTRLLPIQHKIKRLPRARRRQLAIKAIARVAMAPLKVTPGQTVRHSIPAEQQRVARPVRRERQTQLAPEQVARRQEPRAAGNPANVRSLAPAQSGAVVNHSSPQNEAIYRALPVRPGAAIRPASPFAGTARHRDPNAAVIGGAADSNIRSTAAIDGTRTNLKGPRN